MLRLPGPWVTKEELYPNPTDRPPARPVEGFQSQSPPRGLWGLPHSLYRKSSPGPGSADPSSSKTLTYLKASTMAVTIPVTIITIPSTQKRPVHEVKSTCQGGK